MVKVALPLNISALRSEILDPPLLILREVRARRCSSAYQTRIITAHAEPQDVYDSPHGVRRQFNAAHETEAASLAMRLRFLMAGGRIVIGQRHDFDARVCHHVHKRRRREFAVAVVAMEVEVCDQVDVR